LADQLTHLDIPKIDKGQFQIWKLGKSGYSLIYWHVFFLGFWEHDPYQCNWEFQRCLVENLEKMHDLYFAEVK
jgi:hypothetical protein